MKTSRKMILYICQSLDGYIAEEDGGLKWLEEVDSGGTDCGFADFLSSIDTAIIGRATYEKMLSWDDPLFKNKQCYIFGQAPTEMPERVQFVGQDIPSFVQQLKQQEGLDVWLVGGGAIASSFLNCGCIDELILSIIPVTLGSGIPLFHQGIQQSDWSLEGIVQYGSVAQLHYTYKN